MNLFFRFTVTPTHSNNCSLLSFQKDFYDAIKRLTIDCRRIKTKVITLANHSKRKQYQSDHGKTLEQVTNLTTREKSAIVNFDLMAGYDEKPKRKN